MSILQTTATQSQLLHGSATCLLHSSKAGDILGYLLLPKDPFQEMKPLLVPSRKRKAQDRLPPATCRAQSIGELRIVGPWRHPFCGRSVHRQTPSHVVLIPSWMNQRQIDCLYFHAMNHQMK